MNTDGIDKDLSPNCQAFIANATEFKKNDPNKFRSLFLVDSPRIISCPVINKFGWWVLNSNTSKFNIPKLKLFYFLLFHHKYISCSYEDFETHFVGDKVPKGKIIWEADLMIFVLLFYKLVFEKGAIVITAEGFYDLLFNHFLFLNTKNNCAEKLKKGSLKSSLNKSKSNGVICKSVENCITLLLS